MNNVEEAKRRARVAHAQYSDEVLAKLHVEAQRRIIHRLWNSTADGKSIDG